MTSIGKGLGVGLGARVKTIPGINGSPSNLVLTLLPDGVIELSWTKGQTNADHQYVYRGVNGISFPDIVEIDAGLETYTDNNCVEGTTYYYYIIANKGDIYSEPSNIVNGTKPLDAPDILIAIAASGTEIALSWNNNTSTEEGIEIYRSDDGGLVYTLINTTPPAAILYTSSDLTPGTEYFYKVRAKKGDVYSEYSNISSATTNP